MLLLSWWILEVSLNPWLELVSLEIQVPAHSDVGSGDCRNELDPFWAYLLQGVDVLTDLLWRLEAASLTILELLGQVTDFHRGSLSELEDLPDLFRNLQMTLNIFDDILFLLFFQGLDLLLRFHLVLHAHDGQG